MTDEGFKRAEELLGVTDLYGLNVPLNLPEVYLCFQNRDFIVFMEKK